MQLIYPYSSGLLHWHWVKQLWTTRIPAFWGYAPPPHDYPCYGFILYPKSEKDKVKVTNLKNLPKLQFFLILKKKLKKKNLYTGHTWSCLIRCVNIKRIRQVLLKIQSEHDSVHRQTDGRMDGQTDKVKPAYPPSTLLKRRYKNMAEWIMWVCRKLSCMTWPKRGKKHNEITYFMIYTIWMALMQRYGIWYYIFFYRKMFANKDKV